MLRSPTDHRRFDLVEFSLFATNVAVFLGVLVVAFGDVSPSGLLVLGALPLVTGTLAGISILRSRRRLAALDDDLRADP
jgi:membrane associated rhomboid family serine protease